MTERKWDTNNKDINDMPLFRFAEALLIYAEAKAELGTLTQADLDKSVKLLRDRVDMPSINMAEANANPDPYLGKTISACKRWQQGGDLGDPSGA